MSEWVVEKLRGSDIVALRCHVHLALPDIYYFAGVVPPQAGGCSGNDVMASGKLNITLATRTGERSRSPGSRPSTPVHGESVPVVIVESDDGMAAGGPVRAVSVRRGRREAPEGANSGRIVPSSSSGRGQGRRKPEVYDIS